MDTSLIQLVISIGTFIVSGIAIYLAIRKTPFEIKDMDVRTGLNLAETTEKYQEIANKAAEKALQLQDRIDILEKKVDAQTDRIEYLEKENLSLTNIVNKQQTELYIQKCQIVDLQTWASALYKQVRDAGLEPVEFKSSSETIGKYTNK